MAQKQPSRQGRSSIVAILLVLGTVAASAAYYVWIYVPARKAYFVESHLRDLGVLAGQIEAEVSVRSEAAARLIGELGPGASANTARNRFKGINLVWAKCDDGADEKARRGGW